MQMLQGERVLYESPSKRLTLTSHRVRYDRQGGGSGTIKSIMLDQIASCSITRLTHPWLVILAALCVFGGLLGSNQGGFAALVAGTLLGFIFTIAYLFSQEQVLAIASAGTTIFLNTKKLSLADVRDVLDRIEAAKNARYLAVRTQTAAVARS